MACSEGYRSAVARRDEHRFEEPLHESPVAVPGEFIGHTLLGDCGITVAASAAVDEYESVVDLQPAYFPALTRLAYLYFRQGLHARAVETWRRALPVCDDPALRRNIELFMRKLVADMQKSDSNVG